MEGLGRGLLWPLLLITLRAGALRLVDLGRVPVALYCDEAFSGYEAWSLLETARDSQGRLLPLFFDIFGKGWGEPLYIYLSVPAVALFGLTPFAARLVAAMAGTLAVPLTGLMTAALLGGAGPHGRRGCLARRAGLWAALLMAVSPWAFHLSRVAFQASLLPLALASGFWLAASASGRSCGPLRSGRLAGGAALLGLSLYTYTVARLALPLLLAGYAWAHRRRLRAARRAWAGALVVLALLAVPIAVFSLTQQGQQRFSDVSVLERPEVRSGGPGRAALAIAINYLSYYTPRFLLLEGDPNLRHSIRGHGMLHPHGVLLLLLGVAGCALIGSSGGAFLIWWFVTYPAAAALTADPRHAVRAICGQPAVYALAGLGAALLGLPAARRRGISLALAVLIAAACAVPAAGYFRDYFGEYPVYSGPAWQYGLEEAYDYVDSMAAGHDSIYVTRNEDFPHAQLLFYRAFPPREYQAHRLARTPYLFDQEVFYKGPRLPRRRNPIFVLKPYEVPAAGVTVHKVIRYPDGSEAFVIAW